MKRIMSIGIILQARVSSTRLPKKVLLPFYNGKSILALLVDRLSKYFSSLPLIIATSVNEENDELIEEVNYTRTVFYRGSESNVLDRFIKAADYYELDYCVRVCADNPFLDLHLLASLIKQLDSKYDYISYKLSDKLPAIKSHMGIFAEIIRIDALKKVALETSESVYTEHVTNYIYANDSIFKIKWLDLPSNLIPFEKKLRLTVDTPSDFNTAKTIFSLLENTTAKLNSLDTLLQIIKRNPYLLVSMNQQIQQNKK